MTTLDIETKLILNRAISSVYRALSLSLEELLHACSFKFDMVEFLEGTDLVVVKSRDRVPGYIYVSDLSMYVFCPRRFYLSYRIANIVDRIRFGKIREKLLQLRPELRDGAVLYDRETFRKILIGTFVHRAVENAFRFVKLPWTYRTEVEVVDEDLGLIGHVDLVRIRYLSEDEYLMCRESVEDEEYCEKQRATVYEVKSSLFREVPESYKKQAQLYAWLLERKYDYVVEKVYIAHPVNPSDRESRVSLRLVRVPYDKNVSAELLELVRQARRTLLLREPPRVPIDRSKCEKCAFKLICLY